MYTVKPYIYGFFLAGVLILFMTLSTYAQAQSTSSTPGCSDEFLSILKTRGQAETVETVAAAKQVIEQPASVNALTCFDQALLNSAQAGQIFSDTPPEFTPPFTTGITPGLGGSIGGPFGNGTGDVLLSQIQGVVNPVLGNLLSGFGGSLGSVLGDTLSSAFSGITNDLLGGLFAGGGTPGLSDINAAISRHALNCTAMEDIWNNAVIGQGPTGGFNDLTYGDLINLIAPDWETSAQAQIIANNDLLNRAKQQFENMNTPGFNDFNPTVPIIPEDASVSDVISSF